MYWKHDKIQFICFVLPIDHFLHKGQCWRPCSREHLEQRLVHGMEPYVVHNILLDLVAIHVWVHLLGCMAVKIKKIYIFIHQYEYKWWFLNKSINVYKCTLSPAKILKLSITCSAVSVSVDSRVMKSKKASKWT